MSHPLHYGSLVDHITRFRSTKTIASLFVLSALACGSASEQPSATESEASVNVVPDSALTKGTAPVAPRTATLRSPAVVQFEQLLREGKVDESDRVFFDNDYAEAVKQKALHTSSEQAESAENVGSSSAAISGCIQCPLTGPGRLPPPGPNRPPQGIDYYNCVLKAALEAYPGKRPDALKDYLSGKTGAPYAICGDAVVRALSEDRMLVLASPQHFTIAFRGTASVPDGGADLGAQLPWSPTNPLDLPPADDDGSDPDLKRRGDGSDPMLQGGDDANQQLGGANQSNMGGVVNKRTDSPNAASGMVGNGWMARWSDACRLGPNNGELCRALQALGDDGRFKGIGGTVVRITVTGHSLGGAVAEVAARDIQAYMHAHSINSEVEVVAFNAPRLGNSTYISEYQRMLIAGGDRAAGGGFFSFLLTQFNKENDAVVNGVPFGMEHPVWNVKNTKDMGAGSAAPNDKLPYCGMWYAPRITANPLGNHSGLQWTDSFVQWPAGEKCQFAFGCVLGYPTTCSGVI